MNSAMNIIMGRGPTCMTFRHRHFKLSSLIETVEMGQEDEEDEPGDQKSPVAGVPWSRKGGYVLFVRRKAPWKKHGCEIACMDYPPHDKLVHPTLYPGKQAFFQ
jgi:hypothetical protein